MKRVTENSGYLLPIQEELRKIKTKLSALAEIVADMQDDAGEAYESLDWQREHIGYASREVGLAVDDLEIAIKEGL